MPTVPEIETDLEFHSSDTFTSALDNSESQEFKNRSKLVTDQVSYSYCLSDDIFLDFKPVFNTRDHLYYQHFQCVYCDTLFNVTFV